MKSVMTSITDESILGCIKIWMYANANERIFRREQNTFLSGPQSYLWFQKTGSIAYKTFIYLFIFWGGEP